MNLIVTSDEDLPDPLTLIGVGVKHPTGEFSLYVEMEPTPADPESGIVHVSAHNVLDGDEWFKFDPFGLTDPSEGPLRALVRLSLPKGKLWYLTVRNLSGVEMERTIQT